MMRFFAGTYAKTISELERAERAVGIEMFMVGDVEGTVPLQREPEDNAAAQARDALDYCLTHISKLPISPSILVQIKRLRDDIPDRFSDKFRRLMTLRLLQEVKLNLVEDIKRHLFLFVPEEDAKLYMAGATEYWGVKLMSGFPDAVFDLEHCTKCYVLNEWTASVFHAMRAVQHGIKKLTDDLGVTFARDVEVLNWADILNGIDKRLKQMAGDPKTPQRDEKIKFGASASSHFFAVKEAWRNYVMHGRSTYDRTQARETSDAVRAILQALA